MPNVILSIPKLGVTKRGENNKEIYVVSFVTDLRGREKSSRDLGVIAANNETLPNLYEKSVLKSQTANEFVLVTVSNLFTRVSEEHPVSLSGSGILLYPNLDPKGMLASHFIIMESDKGARELGNLLGNVLGNDAVNSIVGELVGAVTQPLLGKLMGAIVSGVPKVLENSKDDILFAHSHSGFEFDGYGCAADTKVADFELGNDLANCTLRIRVNG